MSRFVSLLLHAVVLLRIGVSSVGKGCLDYWDFSFLFSLFLYTLQLALATRKSC